MCVLAESELPSAMILFVTTAVACIITIIVLIVR